MSGKPATPAASRVAVPGAPRLLVYVADPGAPRAPPPRPAPACPADTYQPDTNYPLPVRNNLYRPQYELNDQRCMEVTDAVYYKTLNDNSDRTIGAYGVSENSAAPRADFYNVSQSFLKNQTDKLDNSRINNNSNSLTPLKGESPVTSVEYADIESYNRVVGDGNDVQVYQMRCAPLQAGTSLVPPAQPATFGNEAVSSETSGFSARDKNYGCVNYHILEQGVSYQTVVNQSVNIVKEQVGVRGSPGEGASLVRTPEGALLAVLPPPAPPHVSVPLGWRRIVSATSVLYISPSGTALNTLAQLREYLQTAGTCKCGLPCPLRPENAFSFDPKVVSKPYQAPTGPELAKLCNHKRKLLATLHARGSPAATAPNVTPPPQLELNKGAGVEMVAGKKKTKKRAGAQGNLITSQLMVQKEKPVSEYKGFHQDSDQCRTGSPGVVSMRNNSQSCPPVLSAPPHQHLATNIVAVTDSGSDFQLQHRTGSHYLTVNSGWINPEPLTSTHKPGQVSASTVNVGQPILGANGQIIGLNTSTTKVLNMKNSISQEQNRRVLPDLSNQHNIQANGKQAIKDEESHVFCGLNQPLTPEVMQKINEQQQIFIQQNQKQIEMAMKGFRSQMTDNVQTNYVKSQCQNSYIPQGQLVIQNGTVMKTNPGKTPPWQVKRNDVPFIQVLSQSPKMPTKHDDVEFDDTNMNISDDTGSSSTGSSSFNSSPNNERVNQPVCSRVPPLPQHYSMINQQWAATESSKKKVKNSKTSKKKNLENKHLGNNGMRVMDENKGQQCSNQGNNNPIPSFMDDPNGYLAQQTVLLNNTISRQVGINSYDHSQFHNTAANYLNTQIESEKPCKMVNKVNDLQTYRGSLVSNPSPSPNNTPDSSVLSDKSLENNNAQCCKGCTSKHSQCNQYTENSMRHGYGRQNMFSNKLESFPSSAVTSPKNNSEDNPVTSSTYIDRNHYLNDSCDPIQTGTVSTSNVSPMERLQPPEPSPTPSNSSRSTDTPQSGHSGANVPYCYPGSCRDTYNSNPPTPGSVHSHCYSSPGPPGLPTNQMITGNQMMHFISNHNVNKNLMEVDNISLVGVKPGGKHPSEDMLYGNENKRRVSNAMPGYCPPPHLGGGPAHTLIQASYVQSYITTIASGFSVTRDTVTSVLAGRAHTATTSINAPTTNYIRLPPPPSVNLATSYAIPNNQPDPFINSVNLPTSYPLHIAGTTAQNMISKSPLEMVQNVIGNLMPNKNDVVVHHSTRAGKKTAISGSPGQILISSTRQIVVTNGTPMPPPPPKTTSSMSPAQSVLNQPTVMVNALQTPFVLQPSMMVDGQMVQQNGVLPQMVTGGLVNPGQSSNGSPRQIDLKTGQGFVQGVTMLSPESLKKKNKKKKNHAQSVTSVLQIAAPQPNHNNIMVHHTSPQHNTSPQFSPRSFQLSPNNNMAGAPMLQALTIVPGKSGTPAHIVMGGQGNPNNFGSQQIITNTSPSQQINLLQPVNLLNNTAGVMNNFPAFQQFIVPNIGGMMMTTDGTIIQDNSTGVQLQLQTVNGQNVLTPVQNSGVFTASPNAGVVIRAQNQQGKILQSQHSPGAQFLSPNGQVMMSSPSFNGQLSPLLANLSPTSVTYQNSHQMRSNMQQEFVQTNQLGAAAVMVPLSPKAGQVGQGGQAGQGVRGGSTFVQQNTTIVQQQTTLVAAGRGRGAAAGAGAGEAGERHSVSTQTLAQQRGSPPDTTTHSPLGALETAASPRLYPHHTYADTTTESPEPLDANSLAMVQCVSSSEQDMAEQSDHSVWPTLPTEFTTDSDTQSLMSSMQPTRQGRPHAHAHEVHYNQTISVTSVNNQQSITITPTTYYERGAACKRKGEFGEPPPHRGDKLMRGAGGSDFDRHNLGAGNEGREGREGRELRAGQVVWGRTRGHASWPGQLRGRGADGRWLVRWFGGAGAGAVDAARLLTLTEGLEAHHAARTKHRKSRKLNINLENAIQEAMAVLDKKCEPCAAPSQQTGSHEEAARKQKKRHKARTTRSKTLKRLNAPR